MTLAKMIGLLGILCFLTSPVFGQTAPPDAEISVNIGPIVVTTYNPATVGSYENAASLYFNARNTGTTPLTLEFLSYFDIANRKPGWMLQFFVVGPSQLRLAPGEQASFEFYFSKSSQGEGTFPFRFRIAETLAESTISLQIRSVQTATLQNNSIVRGRVTDSAGIPVSKVQVNIWNHIGQEAGTRMYTDANGNYEFRVPSQADLRASLGQRPARYPSLDYFVTIDVDGYGFVYRGGIAPTATEATTVNLTVERFTPTFSYKLVSETRTDGLNGYFRVQSDSAFLKMMAIQGRHPPELRKPGFLAATGIDGKELWRVPLSNESWDMDVADDGRTVVGDHDGYVTSVDGAGRTLWQQRLATSESMVREVEFSPDGTTVMTGPSNQGGGQSRSTVMLDALTGRTLWTSQLPEGLIRNARFSPNGERVVVGYSQGQIAMFDRAGNLLWRNWMGEFPLLLEIDSAYNVYASGKSEEMFSFDGAGNIRWRKRLLQTSDGGRSMSADGKFIVLGYVTSWLSAIDNNGNFLWHRPLRSFQGHNARDLTADGNLIAVGGADGAVSVFDRSGNRLWSHQSADSRDVEGSQASYDHNQVGAISVDISADGLHIVAAYADSSIRVFERQAVVTAPRESTFYFPFYQTDPATYTGLAVSNLSTDPLKVQLTAYAADGSLLPAPENPSHFELPAQAQFALVGNEVFKTAASTEQVGWIEMKASQPNVGTFFALGSNVQLSGSVPLTQKSKRFYFTRAFAGATSYRGQVASTLLSVVNPNDTASTIRMSLYAKDANGTSRMLGSEQSRTLAAKGVFRGSIAQAFGALNVSNAYVLVEVTSGEGVIGYEVVQFGSAQSVMGLNATFAQTATAATTAYSAHFALGGGYYTNLKLINSSLYTRRLTVKASREDGSTIGTPLSVTLLPGEPLEQDVTSILKMSAETLVVGSLTVESDGVGVIGDIVFGDLGSLSYAAALPLQFSKYSKAVFSQVANSDMYFTGLGLFNPGLTTIDLRILVQESQQSRIVASTTVRLEPGRRMSKLLTELMPTTAGRVGGYIVITSRGDPFVAQALFGDTSFRMLAAVPPNIFCPVC